MNTITYLYVEIIHFDGSKRYLILFQEWHLRRILALSKPKVLLKEH